MRPPALGPVVRRAWRVSTATAVDESRTAGQLPWVGAQLVKAGMGTGSSRMAAARTRCSRNFGMFRRFRRPKEALAIMSMYVSWLEASFLAYSQLTKVATPMTRGLSWAGLSEVSPK